ncbi:unnamed protein product [Thelazia callipaeda]|uniref:Uncharacterized protein n=1 Tax=Thelazia callipaeda TaxID=103827 RepID=A0A0N5D1H4_THECL|nr:unnamed protein product [Thelazia callipaeda]
MTYNAKATMENCCNNEQMKDKGAEEQLRNNTVRSFVDNDGYVITNDNNDGIDNDDGDNEGSVKKPEVNTCKTLCDAQWKSDFYVS